MASELSDIVERAVAALEDISAEDAAKPLLEGGWSRKQVVGHLIDSASNNHQRFVRAALDGSVDFPAYEQNGWVRIGASQAADWRLLLETWAAMNRLLSHVLAHLPPEAARASCRIGGKPAVTLEALVGDYVAHLRHHLGQIGA